MDSRTLISVEEYLTTDWETDRDYIDGEVQERHCGTYSHSRTLTELAFTLAKFEKEYGGSLLPILKLQVKANCYRVADVCFFLEEPSEQIPTCPPFLCAEIVSPEDTLQRMVERVDDYLAMGVSYVWAIDPITKRAWTITPAEGWREVMNGILKTENPALEVPLAEIFE